MLLMTVNALQNFSLVQCAVTYESFHFIGDNRVWSFGKCLLGILSEEESDALLTETAPQIRPWINCITSGGSFMSRDPAPLSQKTSSKTRFPRSIPLKKCQLVRRVKNKLTNFQGT